MQDVKAVITGDLIQSRRHRPEALDAAMSAIAQQADRISHQTGHDTCFTRHRGDGWQIYLDLPGHCLGAALQITTALRATGLGLATRQSIGVGRLTTQPSGSLAAAQGDAFEASGHGLDHMEKSRHMTIGGGSFVTPFHEAIIALADWHSARWSPQQAEAVRMMLETDGKTHADLAADLGITRQALQARLSGAGFAAWEPALLAFQSAHWGALP